MDAASKWMDPALLQIPLPGVIPVTRERARP